MRAFVLACCVFVTGSAAAATDSERANPNCGARGKPVTVAKLVKVFRANGVTLHMNRRRCERPRSPDPHATNMGPSGLDPWPATERREGSVLCHVDFKPVNGSFDREVFVVKYPTDTETHVDVLNVGCSVYPSSPAREQKQVNRVVVAARALLRATPTPG